MQESKNPSDAARPILPNGAAAKENNMTVYNPNFLNPKEIFNVTEQGHLYSLSKSLPLSVLLSSPRNIEEIGIDFVHSSAQLEGNTYDKHDTLTLFKMGQTAGGKLFSDAVMLLNLRKSYQYLLSHLNDNKLNLKDFIKDTHSLVSKDLLPVQEQGTVRQGSVGIGGTSYTPLSNPERLNTELDYLISVGSKISNPFDKALYFHNNLAYLQYFRDCNKRTARNTMAFTLMNADLFPCVFWQDSYRDYSDAVVDYYERGDYQVSKDYFIYVYERTVERYQPKPDPEFTRNFEPAVG